MSERIEKALVPLAGILYVTLFVLVLVGAFYMLMFGMISVKEYGWPLWSGITWLVVIGYIEMYLSWELLND